MDFDKQWQQLCDIYDDANDEYNEAWLVVTKKMSGIASRRSNENPTVAELRRFENAIARRAEAERAMVEFMRAWNPISGKLFSTSELSLDSTDTQRGFTSRRAA